MYDHTFYKQVQISRSDIRPHIKWAVNLVILHMITSIFLRALCGYIWVNILTLSPRGVASVMVTWWIVAFCAVLQNSVAVYVNIIPHNESIHLPGTLSATAYIFHIVQAYQ